MGLCICVNGSASGGMGMHVHHLAQDHVYCEGMPLWVLMCGVGGGSQIDKGGRGAAA